METIEGLRLLDVPPITDEDSGVHYDAFTHELGHAGFRATHPDGRVEYLHLNPSSGSDDGVATVFVYRGASCHPGSDAPLHHYVLD